MTPFSKVKTWIKQGFYEKLPSSKSLRGALDLEQEIMDTLVRKGLATTEDCCTYTLIGGGNSYLVYTALLTQSGTDAPVATVFENTLGGTVVHAFEGTGTFSGTLTGAFTAGKSYIQATLNSDLSAGYIVTAEFPDEDSFILLQRDQSFQAANQAGIYIEVRVYP